MKSSTAQHVPIARSATVGAHTTRSSTFPSILVLYICVAFIDLSSTQDKARRKQVIDLQQIRLVHRSLDRSMEKEKEMEMEMHKPRLPRSLSTVTYCCGACGYDLKLSSSARDTAGIVSVGGAARRYGRRGVVAFGAIDDARFGHVDEFRCLDVRACRLFARRTRLLCRKCGAHLGFGYDDTAAARRPPRYHIKIRALHPASEPSSDDAPPPGDA